MDNYKPTQKTEVDIGIDLLMNPRKLQQFRKRNRKQRPKQGERTKITLELFSESSFNIQHLEDIERLLNTKNYWVDKKELKFSEEVEKEENRQKIFELLLERLNQKESETKNVFDEKELNELLDQFLDLLGNFLKLKSLKKEN